MNFTTDERVKELARNDFRILKLEDLKEFRAAMKRARKKISSIYDLVFFSRNPFFEDIWSYFNQILKNRVVDMYRVFDGDKILVITSYL